MTTSAVPQTEGPNIAAIAMQNGVNLKKNAVTAANTRIVKYDTMTALL